MQLWRLCSERYAAAAFTGEGSRLFEARWHRAGHRVVYTAKSLSLAAIEVFVNLDPLIEPVDLVSIEAMLPEDVPVETVLPESLPADWLSPRSPVCQELGTAWLVSRRCVALKVPSAAMPGEWNVLLNPEHEDFARVVVGEPKPFRFDARMFRRA